MNEYDPANPAGDPPPTGVFARLVGPGNCGRAGTPAMAAAIAVEQKRSMDRGRLRCAGVCGDRSFRRFRLVIPVGDNRVLLGDIRAGRARSRRRRQSWIWRRRIERAVWTGRRGILRHG
jgi:hypothetical protein